MTQGEKHLRYWRSVPEGIASFVYVIQGDVGTPIKVGVAKDPLARLRGLQTGNPQRLRLLHVIPGAYSLEAAFHVRLRESVVQGEWFGDPGMSEFLEWVEAYAEKQLERHKQTGQMPAVPAPRRFQRRGIASQGPTAPLGHRWRTGDGPIENPVTISFVKPEPHEPSVIQRKLDEAAKAGFNAYELSRLERELRQQDLAA